MRRSDSRILTTHVGSLIRPAELLERSKRPTCGIVRFARLVGRENVIAGTDCGFAQLETYQRLHPQVMWAKLNALTEGARLASEDLWGESRPVQQDRPCVA